MSLLRKHRIRNLEKWLRDQRCPYCGLGFIGDLDMDRAVHADCIEKAKANHPQGWWGPHRIGDYWDEAK